MDAGTFKLLSPKGKAEFLYRLRKGLEHLNILSKDLTAAQMAEELDVDTNAIRSYRSALIKAGLVEPKPPKGKSEEITELCERYNVSRQVAYILKGALRHLPVLSSEDLSYAQMAEQIDCSVPQVNGYRAALIKAGLVKRKNRMTTEDDKKRALELRRKGHTQSYIQREIGISNTYGYTDKQFPELRAVKAVKRFSRVMAAGTTIFSINSREVEAANLKPNLEYHVAIDPYYLQFYIRVFETREKAAEYILSKHFEISKFDELTEHLLGIPGRQIPEDIVRKILKLRIVGYTLSEISDEASVSISTVMHYADRIPGSKNLRHLKKLVRTTGTNRMLSFNTEEMQQARMDIGKDYFGVIIPDNMEFLLNAFDSRENAASYAMKNRRLVKLYGKT